MIIDVKINNKHLQGKEASIMKKQMTKVMARGLKNVLDIVLHTEANSTSCVILYQPKPPKGLIKYRRK